MLFTVLTRNGRYLTFGKDEAEAKINFTMEYPSEKIREIQPLEDKVVPLPDME